MKSLKTLCALLVILSAASASAEYMEIEASEVVTIQPEDKSSAPRILVKWALPEGLDEKIVDAAAIEMPVPLVSGDRVRVEVAPLTKSWTAASVSWTSGWTSNGGDFNTDKSSTAIVTSNNDHTIRADVYQSVVQQIAGEEDNFGYVIVATSDEDGTVADVEANDATTLSKSKLVIAYRDRR